MIRTPQLHRRVHQDRKPFSFFAAIGAVSAAESVSFLYLVYPESFYNSIPFFHLELMR